MKEQVASLFRRAVQQGIADGVLSSVDCPAFVVERPANPDHGDFAVNLAMLMAKGEKKAPRQVAELLVSRLPRDGRFVSSVEIAGPGFINIRLDPAAWQQVLLDIDRQGGEYGRVDVGAGQAVQVEFVSANPTGPLHIGHGRGAAIGDTISRLLCATGWQVTREFYYNDAGQQISNLARSVQARCLGIEPDDPRWPVDGYQGDYIRDVAQAYLARESVTAGDQQVVARGDADDLEAIRCFAVAYLRREQDQDLQAFDVQFDVYSLESALYTEGRVADVVRRLVDSGYTYEQDGALWLRTTAFGDDKDRVMQKSDGSYTYFVPDVAYHLAKWQRGFRRVINEQGADHHSTVTRVRAGLQALQQGIPQGWPEYVLHQMVTVMRGGEEVKISKRAGSYVTLRDLIDEVGRDATRYFFVMRRVDAQLVFDIDLAKERSLDNPVYYVQYAHARVCSIFAQAAERGIVPGAFIAAILEPLDSADDLQLLRTLAHYPETLAAAAQAAEPHRITNYLQELAGQFHGYYNRQRVLCDDERLTRARLALLKGVRQVIANGLDLLAVSAPEQM